MASSGASLDLSAFNSWDHLATLGLDRLKSALMAMGLKCGGTLEERAKRLFSVKGVPTDKIDPSLLAKGGNKGGANGNKDAEKNKRTALLEAQIYK